MCIFISRVVTYESLPASLQKFQEEAIEPFREIAWWSHGMWRTFQFWNSEEILVNKLGVDVLLLMLCRLRFCKSFQSDNYVYYDLNNTRLGLV